ncbi:MAG: hypothetical protein PHQ47_00290 [Candidatus Portnoybacteria bacterium]|nr:hypothetical protein [Candidatus Portnoybacteria bacterium]
MANKKIDVDKDIKFFKSLGKYVPKVDRDFKDRYKTIDFKEEDKKNSLKIENITEDRIGY